jgi:hypothetical protein
MVLEPNKVIVSPVLVKRERIVYIIMIDNCKKISLNYAGMAIGFILGYFNNMIRWEWGLWQNLQKEFQR